LTKETDFEGGHVVRILATERVQSVAHVRAALMDDFARDLGQAFSEDRA
jgi:hypothetical protein